jgi:hypothetical protein
MVTQEIKNCSEKKMDGEVIYPKMERVERDVGDREDDVGYNRAAPCLIIDNHCVFALNILG